MAEYRTQIIRTYAGWTALSALRSGAPVKSRKQVYGLLRFVDFPHLLTPAGAPVAAGEFAKWHHDTTLALCAREPALCVGWAAKMVNIYLKTAAYIGGLGRPGLVSLLHPPIDGGLWSGLQRHFADRPEILAKTHVVRQIKAIREYGTYETIIAGCRMAAMELGCLLIEVEQLWEGADVASVQTAPGRQPRRRS